MGRILKEEKIDPDVPDKEWQAIILASARGVVEDCKRFRNYYIDTNYYNVAGAYNGEAFCRAALIVSNRAKPNICNGMLEQLAQDCRDLVNKLEKDMLGIEENKSIKESAFNKMIYYISLENYPKIDMIFVSALLK